MSHEVPALTRVPGISYATLIEPSAPRTRRALCTLWRPPEKVANPDDWAVIGPCYSKAGVGLLVRTLLANPWIDELRIEGPDLSGTGSLLWEVLTCSDLPYWPRYLIDVGLSGPPVLDLAARLSTLTVVQGDRRVERSGTALPTIHPPPRPLPCDEGLPGDPGSVSVVGDSIWQVWFGALAEVMAHGRVSSTSYGQDQREILGLSWSIRDPMARPPAGLLDVESLDRYASEHFLSDSPPPGVAYTYADRMQRRWGGQIDRVVDLLEESPGQRRCWVSLWDNEQGLGEKSPPCLVGCWFRVQGDQLHLWACFRSHDLLRAFPSNLWGLGNLGEEVAALLGLSLGSLSGVSLSAHVYEDGWDEARALAQKRRLAPQDARGNVVIDVVDVGIEVDVGIDVVDVGLRATWRAPGDEGEVLDSLVAPSPQQLLGLIRRARWVTSVEHALWLGREVERVWRER